MTQEIKKPKICKCAHNIEAHTKKYYKFKFTGSCQVCPCTRFMRRERPDKIDKFLACYGIVMIGFFMFLTLSLFSISDDTWNKTIEVKAGLLYILAGAASIWIIIWFFNIFVADYIISKNRKSFPIE